jgi:hypothetical protein
MSDNDSKPPERAEKLDSAEKVYAWLASFSSHSRDRLDSLMAPLNRIVSSSKDSWWLKREMARGLYEFGQVYHPIPGDVLQSLVGYAVSLNAYHFVHLSTLDESKIAFTPSWEDGVRDSQQQITLGKYIKKYHPHVPDFVIQQSQEFLNNRLKDIEIKWTTDPALMLAVYMTCAPACMSKMHSSFKCGQVDARHHPLDAYAAPGFALAYLEPTRGQYTGRCMTWVNPADPSDKRYVRVYGDTLLGAQLVKQGFRRDNFAGARLKRIDFKHGGSSFSVCPYIDDHSMGVQGTGEAQSVVLEDDALLIVRNDDDNAMASNPQGHVTTPRYSPRFLDDVPLDDCGDALCEFTGHREFGYRRTGAGHELAILVDSMVYWTRFRALADVEAWTVPVHPRGRAYINGSTFERWKLRWTAVSLGTRDKDGNDVGETWQVMSQHSLLASGEPLLRLPGDYYASHHHTNGEGDGVYMPAAALSSLVHQQDDGYNFLLRDTVELTRGTHKGERCSIYGGRYFVDNQATDDARYHSDDGVYSEYHDTMVPKEHAVHVGDEWFDKRRVSIDPDTGLPNGSGMWKRVGCQLDGGLITRYYDEFVLRDRERNTGWYMDSESVADEEWVRDFLLPKLVFIGEEVITMQVRLSDKLTLEDHQRTKLVLDARTIDHAKRQLGNWHDWLMRALTRSLPGVEFNLSVDTRVMWRELLQERTALALDPDQLSLDNMTAVAEELNPQPETAVEQSAPRAEASESEDLEDIHF